MSSLTGNKQMQQSSHRGYSKQNTELCTEQKFMILSAGVSSSGALYSILNEVTGRLAAPPWPAGGGATAGVPALPRPACCCPCRHPALSSAMTSDAGPRSPANVSLMNVSLSPSRVFVGKLNTRDIPKVYRCGCQHYVYRPLANISRDTIEIPAAYHN